MDAGHYLKPPSQPQTNHGLRVLWGLGYGNVLCLRHLYARIVTPVALGLLGGFEGVQNPVTV